MRIPSATMVGLLMLGILGAGCRPETKLQQPVPLSNTLFVPSTSEKKGEEVVNDPHKQFGFIKDVTNERGQWFLVVDHAQWFTNPAEAEKASREDGLLEVLEMYIRNNSTSTTPLPTATNIEIKNFLRNTDGSLVTDAKGNFEMKKISLIELGDLLHASSSSPTLASPFWFEVKNQIVSTAEEQYLP